MASAFWTIFLPKNALAESVNSLYRAELIYGLQQGRGAAFKTSSSPPWYGCTGTTVKGDTPASTIDHRSTTNTARHLDAPLTFE